VDVSSWDVLANVQLQVPLAWTAQY